MDLARTGLDDPNAFEESLAPDAAFTELDGGDAGERTHIGLADTVAPEHRAARESPRAADEGSSGLRSSRPPDRGVIGRRLGPFRITGVLGLGSMGAVYQVEDVNLQRIAALKVLRKRIKGASEAESVGRFLLEARSAASLDHPCIARVYSIDQHEGWWYIAM
ncbi:MAG: hypothetical protein AAGK04_11635, partial [Planctomycetota bacterium]